ncbi:hypothetical protein KAI87_10585, partial [Myxococcota bacterium]|nr:hypothetical protein [Myxococcota bacterium]
RFEHWKSGDEIVLRRNDDYFGTSAFLEKIILKYVPDSNIRIQMMRRGELDIVEKVTPEIWRQNVNDPQIAKDFFRIRHIPSGLQWIGWNENHPAFSDTRVRRAMTYLIDRDDIIKNLSYGLDDAAASWFYPGSKEYNRELKPLAYDPKKALRLLEEAGWIDHNGDGIRDKDGQRFAFTFIVPGSHGFYEQLAAIVETDLKRVGIEVKVTYLEWAVYMERLRKHEFDACSLLWRLYPRNDPYQIWHSSEIGGGSNFISFNNAEADKLLEDARTIYDEEKRTQLYHRFSQILHEEQPYTLLFNRNHLSFISRKFGGLFSSARGLIRYEEIYQIHPDKPSTQKN